jgi:hypothetical protein
MNELRGEASPVADVLLGKPIPTEEDEVERVGPLAGVGVLGLDALASASYGPEALLTALSPLGIGAASHMVGMLLTFRAIRRHYDLIAHATESSATLEVGPLETPVAVVPMRRWDAVSLKALLMATGISRDVYVVQVLTGDREVDELAPRWPELVERPARKLGLPPPALIVKRSQFRRLTAPLLDAVDEIARKHAGRIIAVVIPELVEARWYHYLLHGQTAAILRHQLRARGGPELVIVNTPWYLRDWLPERHWMSSFARRLWPRRTARVPRPREGQRQSS